MRLRSISVLAAALLLACSCSKKAERQPVAGLFALAGQGTLTRGAKWRRTARPGMTLSSDMVLELSSGSRAVLEGYNGVLVALEPGKHRLSEVGELSAKPLESRRVLKVSDKAEERDAPVLITGSRYEPLPTGKPLPDREKDTIAGNMAFFFSPSGEGGEEEEVGPPPGEPPPWAGGQGYIHPLRRPLAAGDGTRRLVASKGWVIVEWRDRAALFADELKLPLDLSDVARVVVLDGEARISLPSGQVAIGSGQEAEIAP